MFTLLLLASFNVFREDARLTAWLMLGVVIVSMIVIVTVANVERISRKLERYYRRGIRRGQREAIAAAVELQQEDALEQILAEAQDAQSWIYKSERHNALQGAAAFNG